MSTALGIASVTQVLSDLLTQGLTDNDVAGVVGGDVSIIMLPPDRVNMTGEANQLNLFMYQATYNPGWRNVSQPSMNANGERISNPPLGLDLHYLLTAYGPSVLNTDILLGHGIHAFHETPVLGREFIRTSLSGSSIAALATSGLAEQIEQIKITPELLSIEDISKLWAAFQTGHYRPTAAFKATVVLIEGRRRARSALPVRQRNIYVKTFYQPVIEKISS